MDPLWTLPRMYTLMQSLESLPAMLVRGLASAFAASQSSNLSALIRSPTTLNPGLSAHRILCFLLFTPSLSFSRKHFAEDVEQQILCFCSSPNPFLYSSASCRSRCG